MAKENFSVARVETRTRASVGKFERHIERKNESYENMNVDLSRTPMNVSFKGCGELTYNEYLDQMIAAETVSLKGLKPDAKVFDEMIMSRFLHPKINPKSVGNAQKIEIMKGRNTQ